MNKEQRGGERTGSFVKDATVLLPVAYKLSTWETSEDISSLSDLRSRRYRLSKKVFHYLESGR